MWSFCKVELVESGEEVAKSGGAGGAQEGVALPGEHLRDMPLDSLPRGPCLIEPVEEEEGSLLLHRLAKEAVVRQPMLGGAQEPPAERAQEHAHQEDAAPHWDHCVDKADEDDGNSYGSGGQVERGERGALEAEPGGRREKPL